MTTPTYCTSCGHELGIGRFCTNCGKPVPGRHPQAAPATEATPPAAPDPVVPPPVGEVPPAVRYPLYADATLGEPPAIVPTTVPATVPETVPEHSALAPFGGEEYDDRDPHRGGPAWLLWVVGLVLLLVVGAVGAVLLARGGGDDDADDAAERARTAESAETAEDGSGQPDAKGTGGPVELPEGAEIVDLSRDARAEVPAVAPPSRDRQNRPVSFAARNLFDGRSRTSWRMAGDGSGRTITIDLGDEVVLTEVALINGYAKIDGPDNWYRGNRRVRSVQWEFDDGTRVTQRLKDRRTLQSLEVDPVRTSTVRLRLVEVSPPGTGPTGRDFTAISEVRLMGAPASAPSSP